MSANTPVSATNASMPVIRALANGHTATRWTSLGTGRRRQANMQTGSPRRGRPGLGLPGTLRAPAVERPCAQTDTVGGSGLGVHPHDDDRTRRPLKAESIAQGAAEEHGAQVGATQVRPAQTARARP